MSSKRKSASDNASSGPDENDDDDQSSTTSQPNDAPFWNEESSAWNWVSSEFGTLYIEEGECKWTNEYISDSDTDTIIFHIKDDFENVEGYEFEKDAPPLPSNSLQRRMRDLLDHGDEILITLAEKFYQDWHGQFKPHENYSMWWTNDVAAIQEDFDRAKVPMPQSPTELQELMSLDGFHVFWRAEEADEKQQERRTKKKKAAPLKAPTTEKLQTTPDDDENDNTNDSENHLLLPYTTWVDFSVNTPEDDSGESTDVIIEEEHGLGAKLDANRNCVGFSYSYGAS